MKKFSTDNPFFEFMGELGDWIILNMLFVLTSLPIVTVGMSLTAMYQVALRRQRGESNYTAREYLKACRAEWKQSTILWLVFLLSGALLLFDVFYTKGWGKTFSIAIGCLLALWSFLFSYVFPLQARFQNSMKNTVKNALFLSMKHLPYTILIVALNSIPVICVAAGTFVTMMALPIYCFLGFGLTAKINSIFFNKIFQEFMEMKKEESQA